MVENKQLIVKSIFNTLKTMRAGQDIATMRYEGSEDYEEFVIIEYTNGRAQSICVTADSGIAMLRDIAKKIS